jgi:hypothetical protein
MHRVPQLYCLIFNSLHTAVPLSGAGVCHQDVKLNKELSIEGGFVHNYISLDPDAGVWDVIRSSSVLGDFYVTGGEKDWLEWPCGDVMY